MTRALQTEDTRFFFKSKHQKRPVLILYSEAVIFQVVSADTDYNQHKPEAVIVILLANYIKSFVSSWHRDECRFNCRGPGVYPGHQPWTTL